MPDRMRLCTGELATMAETGKNNFWNDLLSGDASFPYDFRKNTGLVIELNFISARTMEILHGALSADLVLRSGIETLLSLPEKVAALREQVKQTSPGMELLDGALHPLFALLIVHYYTALEAGIDDMLLAAIRFRPGMLGHLSDLGVSKLPSKRDGDPSRVEAESTLKRLKQWSSEISKRLGDSAPQGWLRQLEAVGLVISITPDHHRAIREMVYVRNCIAHRAGRMNKESSSEMSILTAAEGGMIRLTKPAMGAFVSACMAMASELVRVAQLPSPISQPNV